MTKVSSTFVARKPRISRGFAELLLSSQHSFYNERLLSQLVSAD